MKRIVIVIILFVTYFVKFTMFFELVHINQNRIHKNITKIEASG
jgi:hypothetical protein